MELTEEQKRIIYHPVKSNDVLKIIAFAGTGKTTTLIHFSLLRPYQRFLYVAFNKSVQLEARQKFPSNVICKTAHSLAWREVGKKYSHKLTGTLRANTIMTLLGLKDYITATFALNTLSGYLTSTDLLINEQHIPLTAHNWFKNKTMPDLTGFAEQLWEMMQDEENTDIGMLYDGYLKLYQLSAPTLYYDCIFLDEAQDTNPTTADIIFSQSCAKVLVGDPHQQIYTFRGAIDAMPSIEATETMYLTQSFRFGSTIAKQASCILLTFKDELHELIGYKDESDIGKVSGEYTVISRTNAVLFDEAVNLYQTHKLSFWGGIQGYKLQSIVDTYSLYADKREAIQDPYIRSFESFHKMKQFAYAVDDRELISRVKIVLNYKERIPSLVREITCLAVPPDEADIILTTAHKAKGAEFDQVRIANDFIPLLKEGCLVQGQDFADDEFNLIYVAITRTKERLELSEGVAEFTKFMESEKR